MGKCGTPRRNIPAVVGCLQSRPTSAQLPYRTLLGSTSLSSAETRTRSIFCPQAFLRDRFWKPEMAVSLDGDLYDHATRPGSLLWVLPVISFVTGPAPFCPLLASGSWSRCGTRTLSNSAVAQAPERYDRVDRFPIEGRSCEAGANRSPSCRSFARTQRLTSVTGFMASRTPWATFQATVGCGGGKCCLLCRDTMRPIWRPPTLKSFPCPPPSMKLLKDSRWLSWIKGGFYDPGEHPGGGEDGRPGS